VSSAAAPANVLPSSMAQELSVSVIITAGATEPVTMALFFITNVMYFVVPAGN
jgi:hypothetical protein